MIDPWEYANRIKRVRARLGLSQQQLAERLGVSFASVSRWERGKTAPSGLAWNRFKDLESSIDTADVPEAKRTLAPEILAPSILPGLWSRGHTTVGEVVSFFSGEYVASALRGAGHPEFTPPGIEREHIETAIEDAVRLGYIWLIWGRISSFWRERVDPFAIADAAILLPPPPTIPVELILPENIPSAWRDGRSSGSALLMVTSYILGGQSSDFHLLPWGRLRETLEAAVTLGLLAIGSTDGKVPADFQQLGHLEVRAV